MKKFFSFVLFCSLCSAVYGQDVELPVFDSEESTPSAHLIYSPERSTPPSAKPRLRYEIAISRYYNDMLIGMYEHFAYNGNGNGYGTPYTVYTETQTVVAMPTEWTFGGIQFYHSAGKHIDFGAVFSVGGCEQAIYKRTTGAVLDFYKTNQALLIPSVRWNFIDPDSQWFKAYIGFGVACRLSSESTSTSNNIVIEVSPQCYAGFALGRRIYYFNEVGFVLGSEMYNLGFGVRF